MDGSRFHSSNEAGELSQDSASVISIEQLQRLVRLLDNSNVSELELRRAGEGTRLVLRKVKAPDSGDQPDSYVPSSTSVVDSVGALVAMGDRVKAGQLVGTIESLNVFNEVEAAVAGRVVEIFVQDGQPVEYGQLLMTIDSSAGG
jgi:pyruvate carboxylase